MSNNQTVCDHERIELFLSSRLNAQEQYVFELHLESCNSCRAELDNLAADAAGADR